MPVTSISRIVTKGEWMEHIREIRLVEAEPSEIPEFSRRLQESFMIAVEREFGPWNGGPIPSDYDLEVTIGAPDAVTLHIVIDGRRVGGAVVRVDRNARRGFLDLLFISPGGHGKGVGTAAWAAIEEAYPEVEVWETVTPYFERRNINFYINKCGFHAVEFFNEHHRPEKTMPVDDHGTVIPGGDSFFRFEKRVGCRKR